MIDIKKMRDAIIVAIDNATNFKKNDICMSFEYSRFQDMDTIEINFHNHDETHFYYATSDGRFTHAVIAGADYVKDEITSDQFVSDVTDLFQERGVIVNVA